MSDAPLTATTGSLLEGLSRALGLQDFLPGGPVLTPRQRVDTFGQERPSGVSYTGAARGGAPVLPLQVFGVGYDIDLMLVSDHPDWNMHEYARVMTPEGPLWLAKDAREETLEQSIVAEREGLEDWLPEITVRRKWSRVQVEDRSTARQIEVSISYENLDGEETHVTWRGPHPTRLERLRNTSTMGHSRDAFLVALDLSHKAAARHASITIDGKRRRIQRLLGLAPLRYALVQTQAGVAVGSWAQRTTAAGIETVHNGRTHQAWSRTDQGGQVLLEQHNPLRTLQYRFRRSGDALELVHARVEQYARSVPVCDLHFSPALPDVRMPFSGRFSGRYVLDVNGQKSHATGEVEAQGSPDGAVVSLLPSAPGWTLDRPMQATIACSEEGAQVSLQRLPTP